MIAAVIIDIKSPQVNKLFDYLIPSSLEGILEVGMRVLVPFGNQKRMGYIIEIKESSQLANKYIIDTLDITKTIDDEMFRLASFLRETNIYSYSNILSTIIPNEFQVKYQKIAYLLDDTKDFSLKPNFTNNKWLLKQSDSIHFKELKKLEKSKILRIENKIIEKTRDKLATYYQFNPQSTYPKLAKYQDILTIFNDKNPISRRELLENRFSTSIIQTLLKNKVFEALTLKENRRIKHLFNLDEKNIILNDEQRTCVDIITNNIDKYHTYLLKGITGSGKTEVYIHLIREVLKKGKKTLFLVPEISLIAPLAQRLESAYFEVAIISSGISSGERHDEWLRIKEGDFDVVLGTRSACFSPISELGLIVIDECHDKSYQQEEKVIYDALEISKLRAKINDIPLILGSATPSIKDMYYAQNNEYTLLELTKMAQISKKPLVHIIDMRKELHQGNTSVFSKKLKEAINQRINNSEQVIILYNRKGYAPFVLCRNCGYVPTCPNCNVSLTYYKKNNTLRCHYCGHEEKSNEVCPVCKKNTIKEVGVGIELIHEKLQEEFKQVKILRMDANTTTKKGSHEDIWHRFKQKEADILLGTQMVAKGFDFDDVTLVGVLMADTLFKVPSYLATENAFALLTQAIGRAGRKKQGEAIIQAYDTQNYAIDSLQKGYDYFYQEALAFRRLGGYEPFGIVNQIIIEGYEYFKTYQYATILKNNLLDIQKGIKVLGPAEALLSKINKKYRFSITLKYNENEALIIAKIKEVLAKLENDKYFIYFYRFQADFN